MQEYLPLQNKHLDTIKTTGKFIVFSAIDSAGLGNRYGVNLIYLRCIYKIIKNTYSRVVFYIIIAY